MQEMLACPEIQGIRTTPANSMSETQNSQQKRTGQIQPRPNNFVLYSKSLCFRMGEENAEYRKSKLHGPRLHDPGAGDQAPWVQDPQTQCLRPRLQASKSRIYCACFSFNKSTLCAPYMLTAEPAETSGSGRGCAPPRLPVLGARNTARSPCSCLSFSAFL